jgi:hypothetical protein
MKYALILSLILSSSFAYAQGQDNMSKAAKDVSQVDDPLTKALNESGADKKVTPASPVPAQQSNEASVNQTTKQKYDVVPSIPADAQKKISSMKKEPLKLTKEESDLLKSRMQSLKDRPDIMQDIENDNKQFKALYTPSKAQDKSNDGYILERDTSRVLIKAMSVYDSLTVKICSLKGVQIVLDEDISTTLQTILIDDKVFFDAISFDNNRGTFVKLKTPIKEGEFFESSIRMVRKSDDKSYLINLIALPCSMGSQMFPQMIYIKDKLPALNQNAKIMTPENTIIGLSQGLPRINKNVIRVRDMVASSGSDWVTFGVEIQFPNRKSNIMDADMSKYFIFMDNLQISRIPAKIEYLPIQSNYVTKARGVPTMRFEIKVHIDKNYIVNNQYLYMMFLDKDEKHYQYEKIDTIPYFISLKKRGFEI